MSKFFNPENAFFTIINKIVDTIWLSILWTVCSLPLFTIGPACCGLYYATVKVTRRNRSYVTKEFFKGFKQNFKVGVPASLIFLVYSWVLWIDYQYANALLETGTDNTMGNVYFVVFVTGAVIGGFILVWIFPILSRFTVTLGQLIKSTLSISGRHLVRTLLLVLIAAFWALFIKVALSTIELVSFVIFIPFAAPGVTALLRSFIIEPVLKKYQGEPAGNPEETGIDEWYRE
ncbi:MAG: YesL family protein [Lachnospiraceae bacterium]|nr:YesL family protein [Lachnospiraceae bacterium]